MRGAHLSLDPVLNELVVQAFRFTYSKIYVAVLFVIKKKMEIV